VRLHKLYVDPSNQNKGTGRVLLNFVINEGRNAKISKLDLFVNRSNPAVIFYKKLGFKSLESVDLEIGNGFYMNDYRMEVEI
jgi:ribosomal protein S18 acetylase RimI-like enzyme